jgi:CheY-like chemotaxis protein
MPQVLICDDEPHILHAVSFKLSAGGFDVVVANNAHEAIDWLETHTPDFIITDFQMPEIDGIEFCKFLRSRPATSEVPIVMITAKALELSEQEVKDQWKVKAVLMKPFSPRGLLELVKRTLTSETPIAARTA